MPIFVGRPRLTRSIAHGLWIVGGLILVTGATIWLRAATQHAPLSWIMPERVQARQRQERFAKYDRTVQRDSLALVSFETRLNDTILSRVAVLPGSEPTPVSASDEARRQYFDHQSQVILNAHGSKADVIRYLRALGVQLPPNVTLEDEPDLEEHADSLHQSYVLISPRLRHEWAVLRDRLVLSQQKRDDAQLALGER